MKLWNIWAFLSVHCRSIEHFIPVSSVGTKCKLSYFFFLENILRKTNYLHCTVVAIQTYRGMG